MRDQIPEMARQLRDEGMHPALRRALQALIAGLTLNMLVSLGEEIGWRGFLPDQVRGDFFRRSLVTGAVWGVWLAPIGVPLYYPDHPVSGTCLLLASTLLQSPILLYLRLRTGSVIAPSVMRGTFRALTLVPLEVTRGGTDLTIGLGGGAGVAATALLLALLWAYDRHRSREPLMG
jgi:membrane protease YdiL (CAAX protease family)